MNSKNTVLTLNNSSGLLVNSNISPVVDSYIFSFRDEKEPTIIIDKEGFRYKGTLIEDTGEVYSLFKDFLSKY